MDPVATPRDEWKTLPWRALERAVFKLQKRIFRASQRGERKTVHRLQRLLMTSRAARCLAAANATGKAACERSIAASAPLKPR